VTGVSVVGAEDGDAFSSKKSGKHIPEVAPWSLCRFGYGDLGIFFPI
jgi:hypothetical protein